jgi:hypothetical protein
MFKRILNSARKYRQGIRAFTAVAASSVGFAYGTKVAKECSKTRISCDGDKIMAVYYHDNVRVHEVYSAQQDFKIAGHIRSQDNHMNTRFIKRFKNSIDAKKNATVVNVEYSHKYLPIRRREAFVLNWDESKTLKL